MNLQHYGTFRQFYLRLVCVGVCTHHPENETLVKEMLVQILFVLLGVFYTCYIICIGLSWCIVFVSECQVVYYLQILYPLCKIATIHQVTTCIVSPVLIIRHFNYHPSISESSVLVVSRWLWPGNRTCLEVASTVVTWWILAFLRSDLRLVSVGGMLWTWLRKT